MGPATEEVYLVRISLILDKNLCYFLTIVLMISSVVPLCFVMNRFGVLCTFIYQFLYSLDIYICGVLLNWNYLFKMGCYINGIRAVHP